MKKLLITIIIGAVIVAGGGVAFYILNQNNDLKINPSLSQPEPQDEVELTDEHDILDISAAGIRITYHQQAVEIADIVIARSDSPAVRAYAQQLRADESSEANKYIELLNSWDETYTDLWDFPEVGGCHGYPVQPGIATLPEMRELKELSGEELNRKFLVIMLTHREQSKNLLKSQGAKNRSLVELDQQSIKYHENDIANINAVVP